MFIDFLTIASIRTLPLYRVFGTGRIIGIKLLLLKLTSLNDSTSYACYYIFHNNMQ